MKKEPPLISAKEKIRTAMQCMAVQSHLYLLVEDEKQQLRGIISYRQLMRHSETLEGKPVSLLEEIMTPEPITVSPKMPVLDAIALMHEKQLGCLPVIENASIVGMLTEYDLMQIAHYCFTLGSDSTE
jgi:predicted transcriptional regulator